MMKTQISSTRRKLIVRKSVTLAAIVLFILLIILAYLAQQKKAKPAFNPQIGYSYDIGLTTIDLKTNAGLAFKLRDIAFSFSASKQDTAQLSANMKTVTTTVKNAAKTPVRLTGALSSYVDVSREDGQRIQLSCPGLNSCFYYYDVLSQDPYRDNTDALVAQMTPVALADDNKTDINQYTLNDDIVLQPGVTYQLVWILWVNSDQESTPADKSDYGIDVNLVAREVY